jgi:hypothetical protein
MNLTISYQRNMLSRISSIFKKELNFTDLLSQVKTLNPEQKQLVKNALEQEEITIVASTDTVVPTVPTVTYNYEYDQNTFKRRND